MSPADENARIARLEARMDGHELLCTERWRELRDGVTAMRKTQDTNHEDSQARLREIEDTLTSAKGGWKVIAAAAGAGGIIVGLLTKAAPWLGSILR